MLLHRYSHCQLVSLEDHVDGADEPLEEGVITLHDVTQGVVQTLLKDHRFSHFSEEIKKISFSELACN